jgi:hexosaminidase
MGLRLAAEYLANRARLTAHGEQHIVGIQGQLWGENLRSPEKLEYMAFPKLISLSERAWAQSPQWAAISDRDARKSATDRAWNEFANRLGQRELPRLSYLAGGVRYRLPPPGVLIRADGVHANVAFPGLVVRYELGGADPTASSRIASTPIPLSGPMKFSAFDAAGRASRSMEVRGE